MTSIISISEFGPLLRRCLPSVTNSISVAHSGGPDSSCLLYLLYAWLKAQATPPFSLISLTVDHQLQPTSALVAKQASDYALSLGIPSYVLTIPWSIPPFPRRPSKEEAFETVARQARYDIFQSEMKKHGSFVLAMGHHADDNVETLLMRMNNRAADSNENNILSMLRPIRFRRRIGMSNADKLLGMRQWIVRPLLSLPKSRIFATCEHYEIPYTIDQSNFQPSITPRNFIRHCLQMRMETPKTSTIDTPARSTFTVDSVNKSISVLKSVAEKHVSPAHTNSLSTRLYLAAEYASEYRDDIDKQVTSFLSKFARPSPLSTLVIPAPLTATAISQHIVRRILRYVSPAPWGHPSAEAFGSSANLNEISKLLSTPNVTNAGTEQRSFTLGSQVIWRLFKSKDNDGRKMTCWIASRQPPILRNNAINPCIVNITNLIKAAPKEGFQYIWDNRFLITIRPAMAPSYVQTLLSLHTDAQVVIAPYSKWFLPTVEFQYISQKGKETIVLEKCSDTLVTPFSSQKENVSHWTHFEFIRILETI